MTPLRQRMHDDMQLRGLSPKTQAVYLFAVQQFATHYGKAPDQITEEELRDYFLYLINEKRVSPGTVSIALSAIKFLFVHSLQRTWPTFELIRPPQRRPLPAVLSVVPCLPSSVSTRSIACSPRCAFRATTPVSPPFMLLDYASAKASTCALPRLTVRAW